VQSFNSRRFGLVSGRRIDHGNAVSTAHDAGVIAFYDAHPINEHEILRKVEGTGADLAALTEDNLKAFDQDHYGGFEATDRLAKAGGIEGVHWVLDVCSGLGGPARWLAYRLGCKVTGLDLTTSRIDAARRLTARVGLSSLVDFVEGDATRMPISSGKFDRVIGQEAWVHIEDKAALFRECRRVLKNDGTLAFTDIVSCAPLTSDETDQLARDMRFPPIVTAQQYLERLAPAGFTIQQHDDLSIEWRQILVDRLQMYRSLRDTTVERYGEAHFEKWVRMYSAFVGLYVAGKLGGVRIIARAS
jgi:ubiquinone/menaquinone biosynthesis C-methylase UbiE